VIDRPGIQWYPDQLQSADPVVSLYGSIARSQNTLIQPLPQIQWDFGDGTTASTENNVRFDHEFPGPGTYEVTATATGTNSKTREWSDVITIDPPLSVEASVIRRSTAGAVLALESVGGSGELIGAKWTCQDGAAVTGLTPTCKSDRGGTASVVVSDGAGNTASASVEIGPQARIGLRGVRPTKPVIRRGSSRKLTVAVRSSGQAGATGVKVCLKPSPRDRRGLKVQPNCRSLGSLGVAAGRSVAFRVKATSKARARSRIEIRISSRNAGVQTRSLKVVTKK